MEPEQIELIRQLFDGDDDICWVIDRSYHLKYTNQKFQISNSESDEQRMILEGYVRSEQKPIEHKLFWKETYDKCF